MTEQRAGPRYTGLRKYPDEQGGFAVWAPIDWSSAELEPARHGTIFWPEANDSDTALVVESRLLPYEVIEADRPSLREGFKAGLAALPDLQVESEGEVSGLAAFALEARFTYTENDVRRKRWVRTIYVHRRQITLIAQGATPEEFEYWLPMFFNSIMTLELV